MPSPDSLERVGCPRPRGALLLGALALVALVLGCAGAAPTSRGALSSGKRVQGSSGAYSIELPNAAWSRIVLPTDDASGTDFRLTRSNESAWLVAFQTSGPALRLDPMVALRRSALMAAGAQGFRETRSFLGGRTDVVSSLARYSAGGGVILVLTAVRGPVAVELLAGTDNGSGIERELLEMLQTLRFEAPEGSS